MRRRRRWVLFLALVMSAGFVFKTLLRTRIDPLVAEIARAQVLDLASNLINEAIDQELSAGEMRYDRLITLERGGSGTVTALSTDMQAINRLKTNLLRRIDQRTAELEKDAVRVPAGNLTGVSLLSGRGPDIPVEILSIASSDAVFSGSFVQAGINQTIHRIMLEVSLEVVVLLPSGPETQRVRTEVCIAETVLLGQVPDSFSYFGGTDGNLYLGIE